MHMAIQQTRHQVASVGFNDTRLLADGMRGIRADVSDVPVFNGNIRIRLPTRRIGRRPRCPCAVPGQPAGGPWQHRSGCGCVRMSDGMRLQGESSLLPDMREGREERKKKRSGSLSSWPWMCSSRFQQTFGSLVMLHNEFVLIHCDQLALLDYELAADHCVICTPRLAEHHGRDGVMQRPGIIQGIQADGKKVGALAGFERANVRSGRARLPRRAWPIPGRCGRSLIFDWDHWKGKNR